MPIWEILSLIASIVAIFWIAYGPGQKQFRLVSCGGLLAVMLFSWVIVYLGRFSESISETFVQLAVLVSVAMLLLPVLYKRFAKK